MDLLSCDDPQDAIRSLSLIYGVDSRKIEQVFLGHWPSFMDEDQHLESFDSPYFPWLMAHHFNSTMRCDLGDIAYYHRTLYDGTPSWFNRGLLSSDEGSIDFLHKTRHLFDGYDFDKILGICSANIRDRTELESTGHTRGGGPYAFDTFDDARHGVGNNYDAPEMFCGPRWEGWCESGQVATDLIDKVKNHLSPVIVKFSGRTLDPERYTTGLWYYLYRKCFELDHKPFTHTFQACGVSVSHDRIISIIDI